MIGVFVQTNTDSRRAKSNPIGYVIQESGCWEWVGAKIPDGYGHVRDGNKLVLAHRWMWKQTNGPIPDGYEFHHTCANRGCVNPDHLVLCANRKEHFACDAELRENARTNGAWQRVKTHCPQGHPYSGDNLYVAPKSGARHCRECQRHRYEGKQEEL